ncbi:XRE family transcriptional regulator [Nocardioides sp. QY071]|nr:XRE family transcriptional regulator [Nocardioides sp. QY071]WGY01804.1 XRE family transcriptional regulator [Nocardioides sp. QY071]
MPNFDGNRLQVARRLRRMTKAELARAVGVTPTAVGQYEKNVRPSAAVVAELALRLGVPREFLGAGRVVEPLPAHSAHFRSLRSTPAASREQALAFGELCLATADLMAGYVEFPRRNLPEMDLPENLSDSFIETAASHARRHWDIPEGPFPPVVRLLENNGIIVVRLPPETDRKVSAFSSDAGNYPIVLLASDKADKARGRFDAAHELGHLLLHPDTEPGSKIVEEQANRFAAELLMPREQIIDLLPRRIDWARFHELKRSWGVSLKALVYRARHLGVLSEASYRRANQQLSIWGRPEPGDLGVAEAPQLLGIARRVMIDAGIDFDDVMAAGGLVGQPAELVLSAAAEEKPRLPVSSEVAW